MYCHLDLILCRRYGVVKVHTDPTRDGQVKTSDGLCTHDYDDGDGHDDRDVKGGMSNAQSLILTLDSKVSTPHAVPFLIWRG